VLADDDGDRCGGMKEKVGMRRPRLMVDTGLTPQDTTRVRRFVKEATAGQTPSDFFSRNKEWAERSEARRQKPRDADTNAFGFEYGMESFEEKSRTKERIVLGDRSNIGGLSSTHHSELSKIGTLETKPRTKSARRKRKSSSDPSSTLRSGESRSMMQIDKRRRTNAIRFSVPAFGRDENRHFGIIEGMGGGEEEIERGSDFPHRGRFVELHGSVMPGKWEALLLNDESAKEYGKQKLESLRISLRHNSAPSSSTSLEKYHSGEEATLDGHIVSVAKPSVNRVSSFIKQGVFTKDEEDFCVENEGKMLDDTYLGCLSLVTFRGFTTSSESTKVAADVSEAMLARCVHNLSPSDHELHKVFGKENDVTGILFPCKMGFSYEYNCLVMYDEKSRITAADVIFRKPRTHQNPLTESILSKHQNDVGSGVGEIMKRFVDQHPFKRNYELPVAGKIGNSSSAFIDPHFSEKNDAPRSEAQGKSNTDCASIKSDHNVSYAVERVESNTPTMDDDGEFVGKYEAPSNNVPDKADGEVPVYVETDEEVQGYHFSGKLSTANNGHQSEIESQSNLVHMHRNHRRTYSNDKTGTIVAVDEQPELKSGSASLSSDNRKFTRGYTKSSRNDEPGKSNGETPAEVEQEVELNGGDVSFGKSSISNEDCQHESERQWNSAHAPVSAEGTVDAAAEGRSELKGDGSPSDDKLSFIVEGIGSNVSTMRSNRNSVTEYKSSSRNMPDNVDEAPVGVEHDAELERGDVSIGETSTVNDDHQPDTHVLASAEDETLARLEEECSTISEVPDKVEDEAPIDVEEIRLRDVNMPAAVSNGMQADESDKEPQEGNASMADDFATSDGKPDNVSSTNTGCDPVEDFSSPAATHVEPNRVSTVKTQLDETREEDPAIKYTKKEDDKSLTAAYEEFEKRRKTSRAVSTNGIECNTDSKDEEEFQCSNRCLSKTSGESLADAKIGETEKYGEIVRSDRRLSSKSKKGATVEYIDLTTEIDTEGNKCSSDLRIYTTRPPPKQHASMHKSRPSSTKTNGTKRETQTSSIGYLESNIVKVGLSVPKKELPLRRERPSLKSSRGDTNSHDRRATKSEIIKPMKRKRSDTILGSSRNSVFNDTDSLFGCQITLSRPKRSHVRKEKRPILEKKVKNHPMRTGFESNHRNRSMRRKNNSNIFRLKRIEPQRTAKPQNDRPGLRDRNTYHLHSNTKNTYTIPANELHGVVRLRNTSNAQSQVARAEETPNKVNYSGNILEKNVEPRDNQGIVRNKRESTGDNPMGNKEYRAIELRNNQGSTRTGSDDQVFASIQDDVRDDQSIDSTGNVSCSFGSHSDGQEENHSHYHHTTAIPLKRVKPHQVIESRSNQSIVEASQDNLIDIPWQNVEPLSDRRNTAEEAHSEPIRWGDIPTRNAAPCVLEADHTEDTNGHFDATKKHIKEDMLWDNPGGDQSVQSTDIYALEAAHVEGMNNQFEVAENRYKAGISVGIPGDDQSTQACWSLRSNADNQTENELAMKSSDSVAQPFHDIYFGRESGESTLQLTSSLLEASTEKPSHGYYCGQESNRVVDDENDEASSAGQPFYAVYFGLEDDNFSVQSEQSLNALAYPPADYSIPFHDYYFGKDSYLDDDEDDICENATKRIPRRTVQSRPLLMIALFAGMLVRSVQAHFGSS